MGFRFACAQAVSSLSTWGLKNVFHRPAANFPGKIALYVDPQVIADARPKLARGSVVVVGTNGKTTVTNLLADALEQAGQRVVCNRTGANLDSGVATALLHAKPSDWGVFECDELWLAKVLPHLRPTYVVLLNLFRDQLDRVGEIDRIQDSIVGALESSPETVLVYNADDPLCTMIAERASALPVRAGAPSVPFGVAADMGLPQNSVHDASVCQRCSGMLQYAFRQYGQLGEYSCPDCGFARPALAFAAEDVRLGTAGLNFAVSKAAGVSERSVDGEGQALGQVSAPFTGAYMVYNLLAVAAAANLAGCAHDAVGRAIAAFDPQNGRLQELVVQGHRVLLNLAKNPVGFNQNLKIVAQDEGRQAVAFFVNDKEGDGRDVSWLWDIDFEELAGRADMRVFAGGIRANDLQVRLKYAGIGATVVQGAADVFAQIADEPASTNVYMIANYTALPVVKADAERLAASDADAGAVAASDAAVAEAATPEARAAEPAARLSAASEACSAEPAASGDTSAASAACSSEPSVVIAHLFPDLLNLYGDGGNVRVLERRLRQRGIPVEIRRVNHGESIDLSEVDLVFLGGGPDREQRLASQELLAMAADLRAFVEKDGALLAICGGYQILGRTWLLGEETLPGLGLLDMETRRAEGGSGNRLISDIVLRADGIEQPVVGYENHAGRTFLDEGVQPFGRVISSVGCGNNDVSKQDGVRYRNVVGTYLHGLLLGKNPQMADDILARALQRRAERTGQVAVPLAPLDDAVENAANAYMCNRLGVR